MFKLLLSLTVVSSRLWAITVAGTVYNADSTPAKGTVTITWPTFTCSATLVMAGSKTIKLNNGALSVTLCPLDYYTITYRLEGAPTSLVAWVVPASPSSVTILDVQQVIPPPGLPASGIFTINSQTGITQTIVAGTAGTDFAVSSAGNIHTINCPTASATNRGCLSTADWTTFNNKLGSGTAAGGDLAGTYPNPTLAVLGAGGSAGAVINANAPTVQVPTITYDTKGRITNSSVDSRAYVAAATTFGGDVSGVFSGITVTKVNGVSFAGLATGLLKNTTGTGAPSIAVVGDVINLWTGPCNITNFLRGDGACAAPAGAGTVTNTGALTAGQLVFGNGTTDITVGNLSGAVTTSGSGVTAFGAGTTGSGAVVLATGPTLVGLNVTTINDGTGLYALELLSPASSVNWLRIAGNVTTQAPGVYALGTDTNIDILLRPKGTGKVNIGLPQYLYISGGSSGQFLKTDGAGGLSWDTVTGSGTVTNIATSGPITGGPITTTGTIGCATCVTSAAALTVNRIVLGGGLQASVVQSSAGSSGQLLTSAGASEPTWTTATDAATASTVVKRGTNAEAKLYDKGGEFHNVRAYGATGNGATDDRAALQSAIDAETYGGVVFLPPGDYVLGSTHPTYTDCGLVIGNGTTSSYSSQNAITLQGSGKGVGEDFSIGNSTRGATRLKSGTASITKMICLEGPVVNVWINDIFLDGNANTPTGIYFNHVAESGINRVGFRKFTNGWGMDFTAKAKASGGWAFYTCGNRLSNFTMGEASSTSFSGIRLSGVYDSDSGPYHTSCSNVFERFGVSFGTAAGAIGVELAYADNNKFINGGFSTYGGSGKPVNFTQQSDGASGANFPYGNKFINIDSNMSQIYYGTNGNRGNFVLSHTEAEGNADPNLARLFWITDWGRAEIDATSTTNKAISGRDSNGTEIFSMKRGGASTNGLDISSYDEITFQNQGNNRLRILGNGGIVPLNGIAAGSLSSGDANGTLRWCTDCTRGSDPCAASGGNVGVWAVRNASSTGNGYSCNTR